MGMILRDIGEGLTQTAQRLDDPDPVEVVNRTELPRRTLLHAAFTYISALCDLTDEWIDIAWHWELGSLDSEIPADWRGVFRPKNETSRKARGGF